MDSNEHINDDNIDTLLDQLKNTAQLAKKTMDPAFELKSDDLEQFILNNTGRLIKDSMETIESIKQYIINAPEPEDVHSLAELYKASTGAIETLNKILLQKQKSETQVKVKVMDIESKQAMIEAKDSGKSTLTREEVLDQLFKSGDIIEVTEAESRDVED